MAIPGIVYLAALIVGLGVNSLQFLLSSSDAEGGADGGHDLGHDADGGDADGGDADGGDADGGDADHGGLHGAGQGFFPVVLSIRFWTFGLMAFGIVGSILHFLRLAPGSVTPFVALGSGLAAGLAVSWLFRFLQQTANTSGATAGDAVGQLGKVLVPVRVGARGKVRIELKGQILDYLASSEEEDLEAGAQVLVTDFREGELRVTRVPGDVDWNGPRSG